MHSRVKTAPVSKTTRPDLVPVRRVYLEIDEWGEEEPKATVVDEVERWCRSCRSIYPHDPVEAAS